MHYFIIKKQKQKMRNEHIFSYEKYIYFCLRKRERERERFEFKLKMNWIDGKVIESMIRFEGNNHIKIRLKNLLPKMKLSIKRDFF